MTEYGYGVHGRNQLTQLKRYKYLRLEPSVLRTAHLQFIFMGFAIFSIGILIGFNFKDFMIGRCCINQKSRISASPTRQVNTVTPVIDVRRAVFVRSANKMEAVMHKEVFTKLPDKYLTNISMPPPARFYNLKPWRVIETLNKRNDGENHLFIVLVKTAAAFAKRRFQIRLTWGSMTMIEGRKIAVMFAVGVARERKQQKLLEEENALFGDIIQGDVSDVYRQLPTKVLSGYQFVTEYLGNVSDYFLSTDDDCFLNIPEIYGYLRQLDPAISDAAQCGYVYSKAASRITKSRSKWSVSDEIYPLNIYPQFCHGGLTILSFNMVRGIYRMSLVTNYTGFHLEDVLTNGILREKLPNRENNIIPIRLRDPITRKRIPLVWHLGYRKDKDQVFLGIWRGVQKKFSYYDGPFDREKGYRVTLKSMETFKGKSVKDTISYFCPEVNVKPVKKVNAQGKNLPMKNEATKT